MNERWESFARRDAESAIIGADVPAGDEEALERFFRTGRETAARLLDEIGDDLWRRRDLAVEYGCGVGRLLIPMAGRFRRVVGVDVSSTMLQKLREYCERFDVRNAEGRLADEAWPEGMDADLVYSWLVLQHVEDFRDIEVAVRGIAAALAPEGVALLQLDTRPPTWAYRVRNALPDAVLPRVWRRGLRRVRRTQDLLAGLFDAAGLRTVREIGPGSDEHVYILKKG